MQLQTQRRTTGRKASLTTMCIASDGRSLVYGAHDGRLRWLALADEIVEEPLVFLSHTESRIVGHHDSLPTTVAVGSDGRTLLSGCVDGWVRAWDLSAGTLGGEHHLNCQVNSVAVSTDGKLVVVGADNGEIHLYSMPGLKKQRTLSGHREAVQQVAAGRARRVIVSAGGDGAVRTWDPVGGAARLTSRRHEGVVASVVISEDSKWVASGGWDGKVIVWSAASGEVVGEIAGVALSPDASLVATVSDDKLARIWEVSSGKMVAERVDFTTGAKWLRFRSDGRCVYIGAWDGTVRRLSAVGPL
jgi:WD40 repeat protein